MTLTPADFPRTAQLSPQLSVLPETGSTNAELIARAAAAPHLAVVLTDTQRAGRGRLDRVWTTPPGAALALSVLMRVPGIPPAARGWIPLAAGVAMTEAIRETLPDAGLKWPNDVLVGGRKICGILAEMAGTDAVVIGTGVNTALTAAQAPVETATSFAMHDVEAPLDGLVSSYLGRLDALLRGLAAAGGDAAASGLHAELTRLCLTIGAEVRVVLPGGGELLGRAVGVDAEGRLEIDAGGERRAVSAGDVIHVRPVGPTPPGA